MLPNDLRHALTFDDVMLVPAYSEVTPGLVTLETRVTRNLTLNVPLLSSAMDTVTESGMAIAMACHGGIGVIHKNLTPEQQASEVKRVKKYKNRIVEDPITVAPDRLLSEALEIMRDQDISGLPVVVGNQLVASSPIETSVPAGSIPPGRGSDDQRAYHGSRGHDP